MHNRLGAGVRAFGRDWAPAVVLSAAVSVVGACDDGDREVLVADTVPLALSDSNAAVIEKGKATGPLPVIAEREGIRLSFARYLKPNSAIRQSFSLRNLRGEAADAPLVTYYPSSSTILLTRPNGAGAWLEDGAVYTLVLTVPKQGEEIGGFRAVDGAALSKPINLSFRARASVDEADGREAPRYCEEIKPLLQARCGQCHGETNAAAGLVLTTPAGVSGAVGRAARVALRSSGPTQAPPGAVFGADMPIIDRGSPGNSLLAYKVVAGALPVSSLKVDEGRRLVDSLPGQAMPMQRSGSLPSAPLTAIELQRLERWIESGVQVQDCPATPFP
jgi:hypothetical protein